VIKAETLFAPGRENTLERPLEHVMACHRRIEERLTAEELEAIAAEMKARRRQ
jgi:hypothetical protein